jgi:predicted DNA-binding transcriptional regulator AlpA
VSRTEILDMAAVEREYGFSLRTLRYWRHRGEGPSSFRVGKRVVYRRDAVERFIADCEAADTGQGVGVA